MAATAYADAPAAANGHRLPPDDTGRTKRAKLDALHEQYWQPMLKFRPTWQSIGDHVNPYRPQFCLTDTDQPRFTEKIYDNTATLAARTLAAGIMAKLSSPAVKWFELTTTATALDARITVKRWLEQVRDAVLYAMDRSNFYAEAEAVYHDTGVYGTAAMSIEADPETTIRCQSHAIGSYALGQDARGRINTFVREYELTAAQLLAEFGLANLSQPAKEALSARRLTQKFTVRHAIYPNDAYVPGRTDPGSMRYTECYWQVGTADQAGSLVLREGGYHELPVVAPRWGPLAPGVPYGVTCPGMVTHADTKMLQAWEKATLNAWNKIVTPPTVSGPGFKNKPLYSIPGANNVDEQPGANGDSTLRPMYQISVNLAQSEQKAEQIRSRIRNGYYEPWIAPFLTDERLDRQTAAEAYLKRDEQYGMLGSIVERNADDFHDPAIARIVGILWRTGELPPPPMELQGQPVRVRLVSALAAAQKNVGRAGLMGHATALIAATAQAPSLLPILDTVNWDEWSLATGESWGVSPKTVRSAQETAQVRAARAQSQAQQQALEAAPALAGAAKDLSAAKLGQGSALDALAGARR